MHSPSETINNHLISPAAAPPPAAHPPPPASHRRRLPQRVFVKDCPEAICQMQINEIQKLSEQLAIYKNQNRMPTTTRLEQDPGRLKSQSFNERPEKGNQTLKNILVTGEAYRSELLAAQERRTHQGRQAAAIQKQVDAFSREREAMAAEIGNERSKSSILEQELFMARDTFQKYKNKIDAERHEYVHQIKSLRANLGGMDALVKEMTQKVGLLPFYQQKTSEGEYKVGLMNQEILQLRGELRYYQQKSNYFQSNYTVLNENFNNLYTTNLNITNELKQAKASNHKLESTLKSAEQQHKQLNSKCFQLSEQKHKLTAQLGGQIVMLSERIKGEHLATDRTERANEQLNCSLEEIKRVARELQARNGHLEREIESKLTIIHGQRVINEQLQGSIKDLELSLAKKQQFWKNALASQLVKLSNESNQKALSISSQLVKSQENAKVLSMGLSKSQQQLEDLKEKAIKFQKQLHAAYHHIQQKEKSNTTLRENSQQAKIEIMSLKNCIKDYENKLNVGLSVQEQIAANSKASLQEKVARIKELQAKVDYQSEQNVKLQLHGKGLLDEISKFTEISKILREELEISREEVTALEQELKIQVKKSQWLSEQKNIKEQIIARYNSVSDEMRSKISTYYNDIAELNERNVLLEDDASLVRAQLQQKQAQLNLKAKLISEQSQKLHQYDIQAQKLKTIIANQSIEKALLTQKYEQISLNTILLAQNLSKSQSSFGELQIALKGTVDDLIQKHQISAERLRQQHRIKLKEVERISQKAQQQKSLTIDTLNQEITVLRQTISKKISQNNQLQCQLQRSISSIEVLQKAKDELKGQNQQKIAQIDQLIKQRQQMAHLIEIKTENIQKLKVSMIELDENYRNSIEEGAKRHQERKSVMISQWNAQKQSLSQKVQAGNSHLERKLQLEEQLSNVSIVSQNYKIHLESEQIRVKNLMLENELLRKSIKQLQETFISKLQSQIKLKFQFEQEQFDRLNKQILKITKDRSLLRKQNEKTNKRLAQISNDAGLLSKQNEKLEQILKRNIECSKAQVQFLKKANIQLQIQVQNLRQITQNDSRIKSDLSQSVCALQLRNSFLEEYMSRAKTEIACIQLIFLQLKQQRDLLIRKYIVLTNEIYKLNSKDANLSKELDSFAEYFSRVSALHTEINKHLANITHFSQGITIRFVTGSHAGQKQSKMEESIVQKITN